MGVRGAQALRSKDPAQGESRGSRNFMFGVKLSRYSSTSVILFLLCTEFICPNFWLLSVMWREARDSPLLLGCGRS